jgi:hypothetical protein
MTTPNDPWSNPYGQPGQQGGQQGQPQYTQPLPGEQSQPQYGGQYTGPPSGAQPQYGAPQYGAPQSGAPQYGQQPYGQPQFGQQPYGQPQFGQPQFGSPQFGPPPSSGTLVTASVIQIVQSAFWVIVGVVFVVVANTAASILNDLGFSDSSTADAKTAIVAFGLIVIAVAAAMIVLAAMMLRRSNGCRIASIVLQIIFAALWVIGTVGSLNNGDNPGFGLVFLASCVAVVVLLFTASAKAATASR